MTQNEDEQTQQRGPGRPSYIKTGKPGRPKKEYKLKQANLSHASVDPVSIKEIQSRSDKKL